jgi:hypothetical protein
MVDKSAEGSDADEAEEISHDSNAEKRIDVDTPPRGRPRRGMGRKGRVMRTHEREYVMQKTMQRSRRPLGGEITEEKNLGDV